MSSRYTKLNSKYILAKHHQTISQGTLFERDWTTIGNVHRLEPGKRPFYGSGNFIFTENTLPVYKKKRKNGKWVGQYTYEDVKDATGIVNLITLNTDSEKLTDYAYWGSMTELFRGTVEHIIQTFPGRVYSTTDILKLRHHYSDLNDGVEFWTNAPGNILKNPFDLNLYEEFEDVPEENLIKYVALNWKNYVFDVYDENNNVTSNKITYYEVVKENNNPYDCEGGYSKLCYIIIFCSAYSFVIDVYLADGKIVYCYRTNEETKDFVISYYDGLHGNIFGSNNTSGESSPSSTTLELPDKFVIRPCDEIIEDYFKSLSGFEWKILNRRTKPLYRNTFLLPIQEKNGNWRLVRRNYTWPSNGYCIDIESTDYDSYISSMVSLCNTYDNLWCDSIWRCMVHESVKNFDWSYRRQYEDNDAEDNIEGGNRMKDVMRLYGIIYDNAKRYVDGINLFNNVTYEGYNNCPTAQISDRNMLSGWDVVSTQHQFFWYTELSEMPEVEDIVSLPAVPINVDEDSPEYIAITCSENSLSQFYKKNTLPVSDIALNTLFFSSDTTVVEKQENPWISENSYGQLYVEIGSTLYPSEYDTEEYTYNDFPYKLFDDGTVYPEYIKVVSNNATKYYQLQTTLDDNNEKFVHNKWFLTKNENAVTPETVDIQFNRMLNLSSNRILKTKGSKEAIEMAMALFGFGIYDEETNPHGDFILEEKYLEFDTKNFDETFYFYEKINLEDIPSGARITQYDGDICSYNPNEDSPEYLSVPTVVGTLSYIAYYHLNGDYTVYDVVKLLYAHRLTERDDDYYSGVPLKDVYKGNTHLIVPFFEKEKQYEGNLYFESKGGWMKNGDEVQNTWDYSETIPYLHILQKISDLFLIKTTSVKNGDIYFVADVSDYYTYNSNVPYYLSNFFKLIDKYNPARFTSWVNIPIEGPVQFGNSGMDGVTYEDYRHAKHLNDIIPTVLYNNPHCGYDRYDMGNEYGKYMSFPYTYSVENYKYDDDYYQNMASQFYFYSRMISGEKTEVTANIYSFNQNELINRAIDEGSETVTGNHKYLKITLRDEQDVIDPSNEAYRMHLEYMRNVVMKYVVQTIPSTTLLVLENFEPVETMANVTGTITINVNNPDYGTVYGAGTYLQSTMVTLKAIPYDGYHFGGWSWQNNRQAIHGFASEEEITVKVCGDKTYNAIFVENCAIEYGCKTTSGIAPVPPVSEITANQDE